MNQETFETITLSPEIVGDTLRSCSRITSGRHSAFQRPADWLELPPHVELTVAYTEPGVRGDTASGGVTKLATLETGLEIRVPLFIKEGERVKVHTETRASSPAALRRSSPRGPGARAQDDAMTLKSFAYASWFSSTSAIR